MKYKSISNFGNALAAEDLGRVSHGEFKDKLGVWNPQEVPYAIRLQWDLA